MDALKTLLNSIPTKNCPDREEAKRDLSSAISMASVVVIEEFMNTWLLTSELEFANLTTSDRQYRLFIKEFQEIYHDNRQL